MQDEVKVSQADREAAYGAYFECYDTAPNDLWLQAMLEGRHDEDSLIQVLARHRHQAERETLARMEPVAWMYEDEAGSREWFSDRWPELVTKGWTEHALGIIPAPEAGQ